MKSLRQASIATERDLITKFQNSLVQFLVRALDPADGRTVWNNDTHVQLDKPVRDQGTNSGLIPTCFHTLQGKLSLSYLKHSSSLPPFPSLLKTIFNI